MKNKKIKIAIILLAILLAVSVTALGAVLIYRAVKKQTVSVVVPDNYISESDKAVTEEPGTDEDSSSAAETESETAEVTETLAELDTGEATVTETETVKETETEEVTEQNNASENGETAQTGQVNGNEAGEETEGEEEKTVKATSIELSSRNSDDNVPFHVDNMFPGDVITKYFQVAVYYKNTVYVRFHADVRPGYEKLAEVLKCRITLVGGEVLYEGLMKDMPESLTHTLTTDENYTSTKLLYEITVYLDTSVGNDYQEKDLIADFRWWVEEKGNLTPPPTGDTTHIVLWSAVAVVSFSLILILLFRRRRHKEQETEE